MSRSPFGLDDAKNSTKTYEFEATPPPEENWGVHGSIGVPEMIVSEETTTLRDTFYEVRWQKWKREDGTDTTWEPGPLDSDSAYGQVFENWEVAQARQSRNELERAKREHSLGIDLEAVTWLSDGVLLPLAHVQMAEQAQAYKYKLQAIDEDQIDNDIAMISQIMAPAKGPSAAPRLPRAETRENSLAASSSSGSQSLAPPRRTQPQRRTNRGREYPIRDRLNDKCSNVARSTGAASIIFVNDVRGDDEDSPVPDTFTYLEQEYQFSASSINLPRLRDSSRLKGCQCETCPDNGCKDGSDDDDVSGFVHTPQAYDAYGHYLYPKDVGNRFTVVECNSKCRCARTPTLCKNRVAQRPRQVPIEVFKTKFTGWGVRSIDTISEGQIVGIFTGKVISRDEADELEGERHSYVFDLDAQEELNRGRQNGMDVDVEQISSSNNSKWSVDSYECGNWSRFLNHSCDPNMRAIGVVWDTVTADNLPYLALVATRRIKAQTEFTIDYYPGSKITPEEMESEDPPHPGAIECRCPVTDTGKRSKHPQGRIVCRRWLF